MVQGLGITYFICDSFQCKNERVKKREIERENENFDIFVSRIHQPRLNDPLSSYYFKTLE